MTEIWNALLVDPILNSLILLYTVLFQNFALAIIGLTVIVRLLIQPLNARSMRTMKVQQELQPQVAALQKKYAKDREKLAEEQMKLYREKGINPVGGCLPMLIQMPIWIALYQVIIQVLGSTPDQLMQLSQHVYSPLAPIVVNSIPINSIFLWLNLAHPDPFYILPVLVVAVTWLQQRMTSAASADPQTASMNQSMQIMFPLMFGYITLSVSSGLALYWLVSGLIGIFVQYRIMGWGGLRRPPAKPASGKTAIGKTGSGRKGSPKP